MVKGNESLVVCSYTWLRDTPQPAEISRVKDIGQLLAKHGTSMYSELLDPEFNDYDNQISVVQNSTQIMTEHGIWLAIVANRRKHSLLVAQAAVAVSLGMKVVLGCQDEFTDSISDLERHAVQNGQIFYWGNDEELRESIEDVLLPMCDNVKNDFDTIWINQRKVG
jgi:hypothetical protein